MNQLDIEALFDALPERHVVLAPDAPAFTMIAANSAYLEITGKTKEEIIGKSLFAVFPDTSQKALQTGKGDLQRSFEKVLKTKKPDTLDTIRYDLVNAEGVLEVRYWRATHYPMFEHGKVVAIIQSTADVTKEIESDEQLKLANIRFEEAAATGLVGSWLWDIPRNLVTADKGLASVFGVEPDEAMKGLPLETFINSIYEDDRPEVTKAINHAVASGNHYEQEYRTISKRGDVRWVIARGSIERDDNGNATAFPGIMIDITARKQLEMELEEERNRLEDRVAERTSQLKLTNQGLRDEIHKRQKVEQTLRDYTDELIGLNQTKDQFISIASHQLRTPATVVKQYLGMVIDGLGGEVAPKQQKLLTRAFEANERQLGIINDLLKVAQVDAGVYEAHLETFDIVSLLTQITTEFQPRFKKAGQVIRLKKHKPVVLVSDQNALRMVIENLLDNASKYSDKETLTTISVLETKTHIKICVADEGVGVDQPSRLFGKFSRINNRLSTEVGGTGLGLYWAKTVITHLNGSLSYRPNTPTGSQFIVKLPLVVK